VVHTNWLRGEAQSGHADQMMAPAFVNSYLKFNKKDRNDVGDICGAAQRLSIWFVQSKMPGQQAVFICIMVAGVLTHCPE